MFRPLLLWIGLALALADLTIPVSVSVASVAEGAAKKKLPQITLTRRAEGTTEYGTSAYSFKYRSQDAKVHKGLVDLHYSTCGLVHVNMYGGSENRIADVGPKKLGAITTSPETGWLARSFVPKAGHAYVLEVIEQGWSDPVEDQERTRIERKMVVKFGITHVDEKQVRLVWQPLDAEQKWIPEKDAGGAGIMGHCGGVHDPR